MTRTNRLLVIFNTLLATILVLVLIQFAPSVANAGATTIVACADKKTGALRMAYKSCSKKENKVTWGAIGPKGATGARGPAGSSDSAIGGVVRDATGKIVEDVLSVDLDDGVGGSALVFREGALWGLDMLSGEIFPLGSAPNWFYTSDCTGEKVAPVDFYRPNQSLFSGTYQKTSEFAATGTLYFPYPEGCAPAAGLTSDAPLTPRYFHMTNVSRPSNFPGPLYLSAN